MTRLARKTLKAVEKIRCTEIPKNTLRAEVSIYKLKRAQRHPVSVELLGTLIEKKLTLIV